MHKVAGARQENAQAVDVPADKEAQTAPQQWRRETAPTHADVRCAC